MLHTFIQYNYATLTGCVCLLVFILTNHLLDAKNTRLFLASICCILTLVAVDSLELWAASWAQPTQFRVLMSAIGYSLRPTVAYLIVWILENRASTLKRVLLALLLVNGVCSFSALFSPVTFSYSAANEFVRGPLGFVPFLVSIVFMASILILTGQKYHEGNYVESLIGFFIVLICGASIAAETIFHFKGLLNSSCAITVIFYYLYLQTQQLKRDQLTHLRNRHCFYLDMEKKKDYSLALLSLDINDLKVVNDTQGHAAGDALICAVVDCIRRNLPPEACAYRMGGDEFAILSRYQRPGQIDQMIAAIRRDIAAGGNSCAIGVAFYAASGSLEETLRQADLAMYEDKRHMKESCAKKPQ